MDLLMTLKITRRPAKYGAMGSVQSTSVILKQSH